MRLAVAQQESEQGRRKMIELQKCLSVLHSAWKSFQDGLLSATESSTNVESIDALLGEILKGSVEDDATDKLAGQMQKTVASLLGGLSGKLAHLGAQDTIQKLLQRESTLLLELNRIKSDIISADAQIKEWESKHARLEEQLVHAERKLLRERSKVAKKAFDVPESSTKESKEEASQETQICSSSQLSNAESKTSMNIDQTVLEEYDEKLKMFQVLAEGRLTQLQKSEQERATLQRQVDKYASEIQCLPESALQDVPAYKELFEKFDTLQHQLDSKKAEIEQLYVETNELKTSRRIYQEAIQNDEQNYKGVLESEISKLTQDLTRIRANRDSFVSKMEKFQQKLKSTEHNYELAKEKLDFFNQRIVILLEENRRLKKDIASRTGDAEFYKDAVLACEIIQPEDGVPSLKGLYATLKEKELSLRQNDTIDDANHEFVTVRNKLEHYEKVLGSDVNAENLSKRLEERLLSLEIAELRLKNYEEAQAGLLAEIEVISESFTNLEKKESEKDKVIQDKDEEIQRLLSEKHKIEQRMALLVKEKDSLNNKHIALGKQSSKQNEYIKKLEAEKRAKEFTLVNLEKELEDSKLVAKKHEETAQDTLRQLHVLTKKLEVYDRRHVDVSFIFNNSNVPRLMMFCSKRKLRLRSID